jgi:hypothetical protein
MSDPEDFLTRWSRRKRAAAEASEEQDRQSAPQTADAETGSTAAKPPPASTGTAEPAPDLTPLPSIDAITADTDISGFLAPGVPAELKAAALRRAWAADPKIRDFVGLLEYDFDFNTPGAIPGFGALEMTDALRREVARIIGNMTPEEAPPRETSAGPAATPSVPPRPLQANEPTHAEPAQKLHPTDQGTGSLPELTHEAEDKDRLDRVAKAQDRDEVLTSQRNRGADNLPVPARRSHGGALPK